MSEAILNPTITSDAAGGLRPTRPRAGLGRRALPLPGEDPAEALAPGTARRAALDEALAEIEAGRRTPSPRWKVRFGLLLGLERVLSSKPPATAAGTELRKHQIDALAGMLTELIAANQRQAEEEENGNGNGHAAELEAEEAEEDDDLPAPEDDEEDERFTGEDPGAVRRYRFRHPTASGKTIAAAGFVEAARTLGILILTHRRLLVSQFQRDLTTEGYGERFTDAIERGQEPLRGNPITIQTYAWFARHADSVSREAYQLVICDEAHTALGEKTSAAIRSFPEPLYIGMTGDRAADREAGLGRLPRLGRRPAARRRRPPRPDRPAPLPARAARGRDQLGADRRRRLRGRALAAALDHQALNQAAASLYRERFDATPGIVYAAGVDHAYNLAQEFRAAGLKAEAVSGPDAAGPARRDARRLRARRDQRAHQRDAARRGAGTRRARPSACTSRRPRRAASTSSGSAGSCAPTRARRPASSSTSCRSRPRTTSASSRSTRCSTPTSTARARGSPPRAAPPRAAPRPPPPLAGAVARPGHRRTSRAGSP